MLCTALQSPGDCEGHRSLWALSAERAACHPSGSWNLNSPQDFFFVMPGLSSSVSECGLMVASSFVCLSLHRGNVATEEYAVYTVHA